MTRIIAGSARGRRLAVPASGTRPTSDRVREALFSTVESDLAGTGRSWPQMRVLDLFSGSGALGLESLSRGAASVVLVEKSRSCAKVVSANASVVGLDGAQIVIRDAWQVAELVPPDGGATLCFADPPYDWAAADLRRLLTGLADSGWLARDAMVVIERPAKDPASPFPDTWGEPRRRPYGDTVLWYGQAMPDRTRDPHGSWDDEGVESAKEAP